MLLNNTATTEPIVKFGMDKDYTPHNDVGLCGKNGAHGISRNPKFTLSEPRATAFLSNTYLNPNNNTFSNSNYFYLFCLNVV